MAVEGSPARRGQVLRVPLVLRPVPAFAAMQLGPLLLWLMLPDRVFRVALQGYQRAGASLDGFAAYILVVAGFSAGSWFGAYGGKRSQLVWDSRALCLLKRMHYGAVLCALSSALIIIRLVRASGLNVVAVILASQANLFKRSVYEVGGLTGALIMGRHLVLVALVTWLVLRGSTRAPRLTLPIIVVVAAILFLFTSSRLTLISVVVIAALYLTRSGRSEDDGARMKRLIMLGAFGAAALGVFAGGVLLRSAGTWVAASQSSGIMAGPLNEAIAYFVSPVNYSFAFVNEGVAFARGVGMENFASAFFSVLNIPADGTYRDLIGWMYNPSLNQIGLVGEWYTIAGPLLWIPAIVYGLVAGWTFDSYRRGDLAGQLLYPFVLISIFDSLRGFLLPQNILAANWLYVLSCLVLIRLARAHSLGPAARATSNV